MAGDWIKMRSDLFTHPKVFRIASALKADNLRTVGGLMSAWCLFDAHSVDGHLDGYTLEVLDDHLRWPGFAQAMVSVGWLEESPSGGLSLPRFDAHNGQSAKRRAQDADRKREVRKPSASEADKKRTREEKRREEIKEVVLPPQGGGGGQLEAQGHSPTPAGLICRQLKAAGIADVNPGHPKLQALIAAGATVEEFTGFAERALAAGSGFAWILGAVAGERKRAADMAQGLHQGSMPQRSAATAAEQRVLQACPDIAAPHLRPAADPITIDAQEVTDVTPRRLG